VALAFLGSPRIVLLDEVSLCHRMASVAAVPLRLLLELDVMTVVCSLPLVSIPEADA
jgi:hypothetical protein